MSVPTVALVAVATVAAVFATLYVACTRRADPAPVTHMTQHPCGSAVG